MSKDIYIDKKDLRSKIIDKLYKTTSKQVMYEFSYDAKLLHKALTLIEEFIVNSRMDALTVEEYKLLIDAYKLIENNNN